MRLVRYGASSTPTPLRFPGANGLHSGSNSIAPGGTLLPSDADVLPFAEWLRAFAGDWRQGEHVALIGMTGSGKTTLAGQILPIRGYVVNVAVKRNDDTLDSPAFRRFQLIKKWPPDYDKHHVTLWPRAATLSTDDLHNQSEAVYNIMNRVYQTGGWTLYLDDTAYIASNLGLSHAIAMLLSQARSSFISVVTAMTQPSSVAQRVPSEVFRQVSHVLVFRYRNRKDIRAIAEMTGYDFDDMLGFMGLLAPRDFLAFSHGHLTVVRAAQLG